MANWKPFNLGQAWDGARIGLTVNGSDYDTSLTGIMDRKETDEGGIKTYQVVINGDRYTFNSSGLIQSGADGSRNNQQLQIYDPDIPVTKGNAAYAGITRSTDTGEQNQVSMAQLTPRDEFAMRALAVIIQNIKNPLDGNIVYYTQLAYKWAQSMINVAADLRNNVPTPDTSQGVVDGSTPVTDDLWEAVNQHTQQIQDLSDAIDAISFDGYVSLNTAQTILGVKTFTANQIFNATTEYHNVQNLYNNNGNFLNFWNTQNSRTDMIGSIFCSVGTDKLNIQTTDDLILDATKVYVPSYVESVGGYKKEGHSNSEVLLAGGGTELLSNIGGWEPSGSGNRVVLDNKTYKNLSDFAMQTDLDSYVTIGGNETVSGIKRFSQSATFAGASNQVKINDGGVSAGEAVLSYGSSMLSISARSIYLDSGGPVESLVGFKKYGSSDSYVLLAGGGTKPLSEIGGWTPSGTAQQVVLGTGANKNLSDFVQTSGNQSIYGNKSFNGEVTFMDDVYVPGTIIFDYSYPNIKFTDTNGDHPDISINSGDRLEINASKILLNPWTSNSPVESTTGFKKTGGGANDILMADGSTKTVTQIRGWQPSSTQNYVLLGDGGTKPLSDFAMASALSSYATQAWVASNYASQSWVQSKALMLETDNVVEADIEFWDSNGDNSIILEHEIGLITAKSMLSTTDVKANNMYVKEGGNTYKQVATREFAAPMSLYSDIFKLQVEYPNAMLGITYNSSTQVYSISSVKKEWNVSNNNLGYFVAKKSMLKLDSSNFINNPIVLCTDSEGDNMYHIYPVVSTRDSGIYKFLRWTEQGSKLTHAMDSNFTENVVANTTRNKKITDAVKDWVVNNSFIAASDIVTHDTPKYDYSYDYSSITFNGYINMN